MNYEVRTEDGWIIKASRVGIRGEYYGSAERGDEWVMTIRFSGPGAKQRAMDDIRRIMQAKKKGDGP